MIHLSLNDKSLRENKNIWQNKGYTLANYNKEEIETNTHNKPTWLHFGAGNIFRAFIADIMQRLLDNGYSDTGIIVAEGYDFDIIDIYNKHNNNAIAVTLNADGTINKKVISSITEALKLDFNNKVIHQRLSDIFKSPSLQMISFTITEKGYNLTNANGEFLDDIKHDFNCANNETISYLGKLTSLLYERYLNNALPIALVSMDNCSHNGDKLKLAITTIANNRCANNLVEKGFLDYLNNDKLVSFPWTMIDKITPRPDNQIKEILENDGIMNIEPTITSKKTYLAPFVNAEESEYLVVEDNFPNGRIKELEKYIIFTNKETVDKVEKMKVCTCLNPLHTALAIFGCLLGYHKISDEMKDEELVKLIHKIGYDEGLQVVVDPSIIKPKDFIDTVINKRLINPFMPDTPQRIATDTSAKLSVRYGETIKKYIEKGEEEKLTYIPLVIAGWFRYLMGLDDDLNHFELSDDPLKDELTAIIKDIKIGNNQNVEEVLKPLLSNEMIFSINLYNTNLKDKIINYFKELNTGKKAIRNVLKKYL